ncbi:MAG: CoA transferase [Ideonella sp. MAG2]|nr:MAG: CoA transferase [Ideonella sp. MAG2]
MRPIPRASTWTPRRGHRCSRPSTSNKTEPVTTTSPTPQTGQHYPLHGVRVLDMATVVAAPFSATLCADMGAEVVKIELPDGNDAMRGLAPVMGQHALFWKTGNRGKQGVSLDVRKPEGRDLFLRMLPNFDVLVENFRTGTMDRWGLDLATLHRANPRLIILRLTGFGQTGPYAKRPGFARIFEAMSGLAYITGEADGPPQHVNYPVGDAVAGLFGAFAIASALAERNAQPRDAQRGCEIDLAATEALMRLLDSLPAEHQHMNLARSRAGSRATYTAPSNVYKTADGHWLTLVASSDGIFARLCQAMGQADWAHDARYQTNGARTANLEGLDQSIADWCAGLDLQTIGQRLDEYEVPYSKVYSVADVCADPHVVARDGIVQLQDPDLGTVAAPCVVPRFVGRTPPVLRTGPATGEHNAEVYGRLGLKPDELERLRQARVI